MGNLVTLNALNNLSKEKKDILIKQWVSITPPFLGAIKALRVILGGNSDYLLPLGLGLHFEG